MKSEAERRAIRIALVLNAMMFVVGMVIGALAQSSALLADALDMLADASAYAIALMAIGRTPLFKRRAARLSGFILGVLGVGVIVEAIRRGVVGSEPEGGLMIAAATASLVVNATVLRLLAPFRSGEVHMRATWIFTRADVIANVGVIGAAVLVMLTASRVPDLVIGICIGLYVVKEAVEILRESRAEKAE